tara:strand:- start:63068 stop:63379 length:312 start_codon:yes stop_codon:yes gene_type:complete
MFGMGRFNVCWFSMSFKKKEVKNLEKKHYKLLILFPLLYLNYSYLNIIIVKFLPVEYISVLRTLAFIIMESFFDFINAKRFKLSLKDFIVLCMLFLTLFLLDY